MEKNFTEQQLHLEGCRVEIATHEQHLVTMGSDDMQVSIDLSTGDKRTGEVKRTGTEITALALHPVNPSIMAFGTREGLVCILRPIHGLNLDNAELIFKSDTAVACLSFSPLGRYLLIAAQHEAASLYCLNKKEVVMVPEKHEGFVNYVSFMTERAFYSIGSEGKMHLYGIVGDNDGQQEESEDIFGEATASVQVSFVDKYRIAAESISRRYHFMHGSYAEWQGGTVLCPGMNALQVVELTQTGSGYQVVRDIYSQSEILMVEVLERGNEGRARSVVLSSVGEIAVWNYSHPGKMLSINTKDELSGMVTSMERIMFKGAPSFAFIANNESSNGIVYLFHNTALLDVKEEGPSVLQIQQKQQHQHDVRGSLGQRRQKKNMLHHLVPDYTQFPLQKGYQSYRGARYIFYNSVGCIIERQDGNGNSSLLQLQLHDRSRPRRLKIDSNRMFSLFDLKQRVLLYASRTLVVFQQEKQLKDNYGEWELRWENIQAIAVGGDWVAVASDQEIRILDYRGNEMHSVAFDRRMVTMEAYQDMLVVVYHNAMPMWGCQSLKMLVMRVTPARVERERDVMVPLKARSQMKWFGFSEEGMIYCHDAMEAVRCYLYEEDRWETVLTFEDRTERIFIQHIQGVELYGFKIEQGENQIQEPTVLPRCLPRKMFLQVPHLQLDFLSADEKTHIKRLMMRNIQLRHESFRHERWYKLRYSRGSEHPWHGYSQSVMGEEAIKTARMEVDLRLNEYIRLYLNRLAENEEVGNKRAIIRELLFFVERECNYEQTKHSVRQMLREADRHAWGEELEGKAFANCLSRPEPISQVNEISILDSMLRYTSLIEE